MRRFSLLVEVGLWRFLLPALVFLLPWGARLIFFQPIIRGQAVDGLTYAFSVIEALIWLAAAALLFLAWKNDWRPNFGMLRRSWLLVLFAAWCILSIVWAHTPLLALQSVLRLAAGSILFFLIMQSPDRERLRRVFVMSAVVQSLLAIVQVVIQEVPPSTFFGLAWHVPWNGPAAVVEYAGGRLLRGYGTFPHPNILGGFLALGLLFSLSAAAEGKWLRWYSAAAGVCTLGLLLSFSRAGVLAAAAGGAVLLIGALAMPHVMKVIVPRFSIVAVAAFVAIFVFYPFFVGRVAGEARLEQRSISERLASIEQGKEVWFRHPFTGVGIGNTVPVLAAEAAPLVEPPHAVPLALLVDIGLVGFILGLLLLFQVLRRAERTPRALAIVAALAVLALFDHYLWTSVSGLFFGLAALALVEPRRES